MTTATIHREIIIDPKLTKSMIKPTSYKTTFEKLRKSDTEVYSSIGFESRTHMNYLHYLAMCYNYHYGVVVSPDMIWFTILNECATHIKDNADYYESKFTFSKEGKIEIVVDTSNPIVMPVDALIERLRGLVPVGVDVFLPEFSTQTELGLIAHYAAFCDAVSPYYEYGMKMCGIYAVRVLGTDEDWTKIQVGLDNLKPILDKLTKYLDKASDIVTNIISGDKKFFEKIYADKRCGSGGEREVQGWFSELTPIKKEKGNYMPPKYLENFPSHAASFDYKNLDTDTKFRMSCGIFESKIDGDYLVPSYGQLIFQIKDAK